MSAPADAYARRALVAVALAAAGTVVLLFLWYARSVLLLAFGGVLLAVFFRTVSVWVSKHTPLSARWALGLVVVLIVGTLGLAFWWRGPAIGQEVAELRQRVPAAVGQLQQRLEQNALGQQVVEQLRAASPDMARLAARITGVASTLVGVLGSAVVVIFLGITLALQPEPYVNGIVRLVPHRGRARAHEVLGALHHTLARWLVGEALAMLFIGAITAVGLVLLHVPLVFTLSLIAGLLEFIPYVGPIASGVPAVLLAFTQGPERAFYVFLLYLGIQSIEGYILQPMLQYKAVWLPPALLIIAQVVLGLFGGLVGVAVAAPLTAVLMVLVKQLYVEGTLGDHLDGAGADGGHAPAAG